MSGETDTWHKLGVVVAILALFVAILAAVADWLNVPEVRRLLGPSEVASPSPAPPPSSPEKRIDRYSVRVFNCDDACRALVHGKIVAATGFAEDSGWVDITSQVGSIPTSITFQVLNSMGAIAYGFQVRKNNALIFEQVCGTASIEGCEGNRQDFPTGIGREFQINVGGS